MNNSLQSSTPTDDFENGEFDSVAEPVGDLGSKKDISNNSKGKATEFFYNGEERVKEIEEQIKHLEVKMKPLLDNILSELTMYNILDDELRVLIVRLNRAKINSLIPNREVIEE